MRAAIEADRHTAGPHLVDLVAHQVQADATEAVEGAGGRDGYRACDLLRRRVDGQGQPVLLDVVAPVAQFGGVGIADRVSPGDAKRGSGGHAGERQFPTGRGGATLHGRDRPCAGRDGWVRGRRE